MLTKDMAESIAVALVSSRLDYANSVLFGTSTANLYKIQRVQNTVAKIVLNDSVLPSSIALRQLQWLHVKQRIYFKITLTYRTLLFGSPSYFSSLINFNNPPEPLCSSSFNLLHVLFTAKAIGRKTFRFAAPAVWNSIPQNIRLLPSIGSFKRSLKTHLFSLPG